MNVNKQTDQWGMSKRNAQVCSSADYIALWSIQASIHKITRLVERLKMKLTKTSDLKSQNYRACKLKWGTFRNLSTEHSHRTRCSSHYKIISHESHSPTFCFNQ